MCARLTKQLVRLREKKLKKGVSSLYLDIYEKGHRSYEFLNIYIKNNPKTAEERIDNDNNLKLAEKVRSTREYNLQHERHNIASPLKLKTDFIKYFENFLINYPNKDIRIVKYSLAHFKDFINKDRLTPKSVTPELLINFKRYLDENLNGETPHNYFSKLKQVTNRATEDGLFVTNPAEGIKNRRQQGLKKSILSEDEIVLLAKAECNNKEVKRAFLFTCFTGLRHSDVKELKWSDIDNYRLIKYQSKTSAPVYIDLSTTAKSLLGEPKKPNEKVFSLPSISSSLRSIKLWAENAKIPKNITWHSSRHSFAVNLLTNHNDIKTVSHLLGHTSLKHTEKYLRVVDELNKKAINSLKPLEF